MPRPRLDTLGSARGRSVGRLRRPFGRWPDFVFATLEKQFCVWQKHKRKFAKIAFTTKLDARRPCGELHRAERSDRLQTAYKHVVGALLGPQVLQAAARPISFCLRVSV